MLANRIDIFPNDRHVGNAQIKSFLSANEAELITYHPKEFGIKNMHLIININHKRGKYLRDKFNLGLKKLKESYNTGDSDDYDLIDHLIDYYIKIINENFRNMEKKVNEGLLEQSVILNDRLQGQIKKIWKKEDILLINGYFDILKSNNNNNNRVFDSINVFLDGKDEIIQKFIKKYSTEL